MNSRWPAACWPASIHCWWKRCAGSLPAACSCGNTAFTSTAHHWAPRFSWDPTTSLHDGRPMRILVFIAALLLALPASAAADELAPFHATYEAWYGDRHVGEADMRLERREAPNWEIDLQIRANRGLIGLARLNMLQSTLFDVHHDGNFFRPLTQRTVRKALLFGRSRSEERRV